MNWQSIGILGWLALALATAAVVVWAVYWKRKRRATARAGLVLALAALACAWTHSATHVSRIETDPTAKLAEMKAQEEARRRAVLDSRGEEVAQIRFAEDDSDAFLDKAGLEESDLKYLESVEEPEWRKQKQLRSGGAEDDSLEGMIDDSKSEGGADVATLEAQEKAEPILMSEAEVIMARRIDRWMLGLAKWLPVIALLVLFHDYLRRTNRYAEATLPLPLPSALANAVTPMPPLVVRPDPPRRTTVEELAWLARRGDAFLYLTDDPAKADAAAGQLAPLAGKRRLDVLRVTDATVTDDFIFESLWFNRASFLVDSKPRATQILDRFSALLRQRCETRARTSRPVHIVWDLESPIPAASRDALVHLAGRAGFSLFLMHPKPTP